MNKIMDKQEYIDSLPKKLGSARVLFQNEADQVLVLKLRHTNKWSLPGGSAEKWESPRDNCIREIKEELSLDVTDIQLVSVNHITDKKVGYETFSFTFYGGILTQEQIDLLQFQEEEILDHTFIDPTSHELEGDDHFFAIKDIVEAINSNCILYLENGHKV